MIATRNIVSLSLGGARRTSLLQFNYAWQSGRGYQAAARVTENLSLVSADGGPWPEQQERPLAVMIPWLMAKGGVLSKYASFYTDQGFDVLMVRVSPRHMFTPVTGSQVVASELLEYLRKNYMYNPLLVHGFSVGGYLWGEVCVKAHEQIAAYQPVLDRFVGQIWDSATDITETPIGISRAVFPTNVVLQKALFKYIKYHMRAFHDLATCHYIRSSQMFHTNLVKAPALFLVSKADPVGSEVSNRRVHDSWASRGVKTYWKCWEASPHVGHYRKYPKEYAAELFAFLDRLRLVQNPEKMRAKM